MTMKRRRSLDLFLLAVPACARVRPSEAGALWALYEAGGGAQWTNNEHWNVHSDPCRKFEAPVPNRFNDMRSELFSVWHVLPTQPAPCPAAPPLKYCRVDSRWCAGPGARFPATPWFGVGCMDPCDDYLDGEGCTAGRVSSLRLGDNNLNGTLTAWQTVGEMANISFFDLSYNRLSGTLPSQLGRLNNVEVITVRDNQLRGLLPAEIAHVNSNGGGHLREFTLANNALSGTLPAALGRHTLSLESLDVHGNHLSGTLPAALGNMTQLQVLFLHNNSFSGTLPASFGVPGVGGGGLPRLRYFDAVGLSGLSGTLPTEIGLLGYDERFSVEALRANLHTLRLSSCAFSGTLPTQIGRLTELRTLRIDDNQLSGSLPTELGQLTKLETLDVYDNQWEGDMPSELAQLINLRLLYLPNEQLKPLRLHYCQQRLPSLGKYSYRLVREEYLAFSAAVCPEPYDTLTAFGTLSQLTGDI